MSNGLFILRKVDGVEFSPEQLAKEFGKSYFEIDNLGTFVNDDFPRDSGVVEEIMSHSVGWELFSEDWKPLAFYRDLNKAITARDNAKIVINTEIELEDEEGTTSQIGRAARRQVAASV